MQSIKSSFSVLDFNDEDGDNHRNFNPKRKATKILQTAEEQKISAGKDPMGLAAAALYVACVTNGENKTQRDVAEAAGVTEVTIRNRYKGLKVALDL